MERTPLRLDAASFQRLFEWFGPSLGWWRAAEIAALRLQTWQRPILDLGCGDGLVMSQVLEKVEYGLDPDRQAAARAAQLGIYEEIIPEWAEDAALPDNWVGTIVSNSALEHSPRLDDTLRFCARVLRPGGCLIITTPTAAFSRWLALPLPAYARWRNRSMAHLNLLTAEQWQARLEAAGLIPEVVLPYMPRRMVRQWDALELLQMPRLGKHRLFGMVWRLLPASSLQAMALRAARLDLSAPPPGGGQLLVARKP